MTSTKEYPKKSVILDSKKLAYVEIGEGAPIVFLHGNPTSSYLWRNVIPHLSASYRCLAPDLVGMGDSEKLDNVTGNSYRFVEHCSYLDLFFEQMNLDKVVLVVHDWGSVLGFDWARRHSDSIRGITYMEGIVKPLTWNQWNKNSRSLFEALRSPAGEDLVLNRNIFVERILPGSILRKITDIEMDVYRRPFSQPGEDRRPTLTWPREIPIDGSPEDVHKIVSDYASWMTDNNIPKLFINAEPGAILIGEQRDFCRTWKNQSEITVKGSHFIQEDAPDEIGLAIADWMLRLD